MKNDLSLCLALLFGLALPAPLAAQDATAPYRLTIGDRVQISWIGGGERLDATVDIDGRVRLPGIGAVVLSGLTLDAGEDAVETAMSQAGQFVDPQATVSILAYAPVLIAGDVYTPGSYAYLPGLTVGTALGLSGGSRGMGLERDQLMRARAEIEGRIVTLNAAIMVSVTTLSRLEAQRDGRPEVALLPGLRAVIPAPSDDVLRTAMADEQAILAAERQRRSELTAAWDREVETLVAQKALLLERVDLQDKLVFSLGEALLSAQELREKGLLTETLLIAAEQRDAEARARAIELQSALATVERGIADATRQRIDFLRQRETATLIDLRDERQRLSDLLLRHGTAVNEAAILADGNAQSLLDSGAFALRFTLVRARPDAPAPADITADTPLLPGDSLTVRVQRDDPVALAGEGG